MKFQLSALIAIITICSTIVAAQTSDTIHVTMKSSFTLKNLHTRVTVPVLKRDDSKCKGYPVCSKYQIGICVLNKGQYFFDQYRKKKRSTEDFKKDILRYKIDTNTLSRESIKTYVNIFTGLIGTKKVIIVDVNNDEDFANDIKFEFDTLFTSKWFRGDTIEMLPLVQVSYEVMRKGKLQKENSYIRIKPYDYSYNYRDELDKKLAVYTIHSVSKEGFFRINNIEFKVSLCLSPTGTPENLANGYYYKIQRKENDYLSNIYEQGRKETVVSGHVFKAIDYNTDEDLLSLLYIGFNDKSVGGHEGFFVPKIQGKDSEGNNVDIEYILQKNKYILFDFWGSWCLPCLKNMSLLKELYSTIDTNRIEFIGINYEYNYDGKEKAKNIITSNNILWRQIAETPPSDKKGVKVAEILDVRSYPTLILVSPDGEVIARETGEDNMQKIKEFIVRKKLLLLR